MKKRESLSLLLATLLVVALCMCLFTGCAAKSTTTPSTPVAPVSPTQIFQQPVLTAAQSLSDAANGAVHAAITLRDSGKISLSDTQKIENYSVSAARLSDALITELQSADDLSTQKAKVLLILQANILPVITGLSSQAGQLIATSITLVAQIRAQMGVQ